MWIVGGDVEIAGRPNKAGGKGIEARLKFDVQHVTSQALSDRIGEDRDIDEMKHGDDYHLYSLITCVCSNVSERKVWNSYRKIPGIVNRFSLSSAPYAVSDLAALAQALITLGSRSLRHLTWASKMRPPYSLGAGEIMGQATMTIRSQVSRTGICNH
jgi:hypothetical protein